MFENELALTEQSELEMMGVFEEWKVAMELNDWKLKWRKQS